MKEESETTFKKWLAEIDRYMIKKSALNVEHAGWDGGTMKNPFNDGENPVEVVE